MLHEVGGVVSLSLSRSLAGLQTSKQGVWEGEHGAFAPCTQRMPKSEFGVLFPELVPLLYFQEDAVFACLLGVRDTEQPHMPQGGPTPESLSVSSWQG